MEGWKGGRVEGDIWVEGEAVVYWGRCDMEETLFVLSLIPGAFGVLMLLDAYLPIVNESRVTLQVDQEAKRRAIPRLAIASALCGASFFFVVLLIALDTSEIEGSVFFKVLTALALGVGTMIVVFGVVLFELTSYEYLMLPARRKLKERRVPEKKEE